MRTFIKNYIDAKKRQKLEETGEEGFSLIELIIVVVILGILVAIAIPVFGAIQAQAEASSLDAAAANGASAVAAAIADGTGTGSQTVAAAVNSANTASDKFTISTANTDTTPIDDVCVTATLDRDPTVKAYAGPGLTAAGAC